MPHRIFRAWGWALAMAAACSGGAPGKVSPTTDDVAVYRAVLAPEPRIGVLRRIVQRTTEPTAVFHATLAERVAVARVAMPALDTSTVRSFLALNSQVAAIPDLRDATLSWMSAKEWRALTDSYARWGEFVRRYPYRGGVSVLSRIGYSRDRAQALVYLTRHCPPCGSVAEFVLLSRVNGVWTVVARWTDWET